MDNPNTYTDSRGTIKDLLVTDEYSITHITFNKGAVRGNHYHKETTQHDFVLKGSLKWAIGKHTGVISKGGDLNIWSHCPHAYKALEDSEMLSICFGKRRGEHYEEDTFRLVENEKLI